MPRPKSTRPAARRFLFGRQPQAAEWPQQRALAVQRLARRLALGLGRRHGFPDFGRPPAGGRRAGAANHPGRSLPAAAIGAGRHGGRAGGADRRGRCRHHRVPALAL
ncbi:hypothetical protein G6F63_014168 [Rhizopus arrhizus]|nr:hypothetical protein G6F63_014168 [Rhizopus arrhizus]